VGLAAIDSTPSNNSAIHSGRLSACNNRQRETDDVLIPDSLPFIHWLIQPWIPGRPHLNAQSPPPLPVAMRYRLFFAWVMGACAGQTEYFNVKHSLKQGEGECVQSIENKQ
jgi:hypothetical protein